MRRRAPRPPNPMGKNVALLLVNEVYMYYWLSSKYSMVLHNLHKTNELVYGEVICNFVVILICGDR